MNVNVAAEGISIPSFRAFKPDDPRHDRISPGRIRPQDFPGRPSTFENRSCGGSTANFSGNSHRSQRGIHASRFIPQSELRG